jgi:class II lanthipeptide synthase
MKSAATFPAGIMATLEEICRATTILTPEVFRIGDGAPEMTFSRATLIPSEPLGDPLVRALTFRLYDIFYCRRSHYAFHDGANDNLVPVLSQANVSREGWEPGWEVAGRDDAGNVVVKNGERTRLAQPEDYRIVADHPTHAGVEIRRKREDDKVQRGFYYAYGETLGDRYEDLVGARIYLNLTSATAPRWMNYVTQQLNLYRVPFAFKVVSDAREYGRVDTAVVYVPRRRAGFAAALLVAAGHRMRGLRAPVPLFARKLAAGISIADNPPGGDSFGISRMQLVAQGMVEAWRNGKSSVRSRVREITKRFRCAGLDVRTPWLNSGNKDIVLPPAIRSGAPRSRKHSSEWLEVADRIGRRLVRDAIWFRDQCTWMGWFVVPEAGAIRVAYCTAGADLYSGTAGIAMFLSRLSRITGDSRVKATALGALRHSLARSRGAWRIGAYSGLAGLLHGVQATAEALNSDEGNSAIPRILTKLHRSRPGARQLDIMEGRAGAIRVLVRMAAKYRHPEALELAVEMGEEIIAEAVRDDDRWSWNTISIPAVRPLVGYSHGTSGIACALYDLSRETGDPKFLEAANGALRYEASTFNAANKNWPDYRRLVWEEITDNGDDRFMVAWCNGAPGIALTLARLAAKDRDAAQEGYLDAAIETTLASLPPRLANSQKQDFCLCHGVAGNAEILLQIHQVTNRDGLFQAASRAAEDGIRHDKNGSWPCGIEGAGESPGLLVGLAGIGHFYLRMHDQSIESPLVL